MYQVIYNVHVRFVCIRMYVRVGVTYCFKRKRLRKSRKTLHPGLLSCLCSSAPPAFQRQADRLRRRHRVSEGRAACD